jgi:hypothetical protein
MNDKEIVEGYLYFSLPPEGSEVSVSQREREESSFGEAQPTFSCIINQSKIIHLYRDY